jgi:kynureninase
MGDADGAETRLQMASQLGLDPAAARAMQGEIDWVRETVREVARRKERAARRRKALGEALAGLVPAIATAVTRTAAARLIALLTIALVLLEIAKRLQLEVATRHHGL